MTSPAIVIDVHSSNLKIGLSNKEAPSFIIPSIIGRPSLKNTYKIEDYELKPIMIGDEVTPVRQFLELSKPFENDKINDYYDAEILLDYLLFKKLKLNKNEIKDRKFFLVESPLSSGKTIKEMAEILFERIGVRFLNFGSRAKMELYAEGNNSGVVIESGHNKTNIIPIMDGDLIRDKISSTEIGGEHITEYLSRLLLLKGYDLFYQVDYEFIKKIKEKHCFVSCDIDSDRKLERKTTYYNSYEKLPDGRKIRISSEKFEAPEILFTGNPFGYNMPGIHELCFSCINVSIFIYFKLFYILEI